MTEAKMTTICEYYALCTNQTDRGTRHPVLGEVPTCQRCADKHDLTTHPLAFTR